MSPKWAEVKCDRHGSTEAGSENWKPKHVTVAIPKNKRERVSGCPFCSAEKKAASQDK